MSAVGSPEFGALCDDALERIGLDLKTAEVAAEVAAEQRKVLGLSEFIVRGAQRDPQEFERWLASRAYVAPLPPADIQAMLAQCRERLPPAMVTRAQLPELQQALRSLRNVGQRHLVWRHLAGRAPFAETTASLTALADGVLELALDWCHAIASASHGEPRAADGAPQRLVVLALGKLGGGELNLSSDIDLICGYSSKGTTTTGQTNQQFFVLVVQLLLKIVAEVTGDGFAFRVDLRLRPFGDSGALVQHFNALEHYYEASGRDWERYALIKARPCAGDLAAGYALLERLQPFVYRRYLDFAAIDALREMRSLIRADQHAHLGNVKLGAGGIRDIEFLAQMLQLIWGGRTPALRTPRLETTLDALVGAKLLKAAERDGLWRRYLLLRDTEHCLQGLRDAQTHELPDDATDQLRIAAAMDRPDYAALCAELDAARTWVVELLAAWLEEGDAAALAPSSAGRALWQRGVLADTVTEAVAGRTLSILDELREAARRGDVAVSGNERLDALMPALLGHLLDHPEPDAVLLRLAPLLYNVLRRSAYLVLLTENAAVRSELVRLARSSDYFSSLLARHPALLDELFLRSAEAPVPDREALRAELATMLPPLRGEAEQAHFDALGQFKAQHQFRGLLALTRNGMTVMQLGDYLTYLAEVVVEVVLEWAWYGVAPDDEPLRDFVVVAYGKFGGFELGANSDLDLVFIHDWELAQQSVLHKLVRRLLNFLGMQTYFGQLYEVDIRLRPSGRDGLLVSTFDGFAAYQRKSAWLWEHQALVRARVVAGCPLLSARFAALRRAVLGQPRDTATIRQQVLDMRTKLVDSVPHSGGAPDALADLKKGLGGIVDIEFMVQYLVLNWAARYPVLLDYPDNARVIETARDCGLLTPASAAQMIADYAALRRVGQLALVTSDTTASTADEMAAVRHSVYQQWRSLMQLPPQPQQPDAQQ